MRVIAKKLDLPCHCKRKEYYLALTMTSDYEIVITLACASCKADCSSRFPLGLLDTPLEIFNLKDLEMLKEMRISANG